MATAFNSASPLNAVVANLGSLGRTEVQACYLGTLTGSNSTVQSLFTANEDITIVGAKLQNGATIAAHTENYGTLTVYNRGAAGSGTTSVATLVTNATTVAIYAPVAATVSTTAANLVIDDGEALAAAWTEDGTGQDLTLATLTVEYKRASNDEAPVFTAPGRCKIVGVHLINGAAITGHTQNYGTLTVYNRGTAGSGTTSVAARATDTATTDDIAAKTPWEVTLSTTPANLYLEEGEQLTAAWAQTGTGGILTEAELAIEWVYAVGAEV